MSQRLREGKKDYSIVAYVYCKAMFLISTKTFYRRFQIDKTDVLKKNQATVVVLNHANAFMDPVACAFSFDFRGFYMARGDAFKNKVVASFLYGIGILPIFRMSDAGREGVLKNDISYRAFSNHLKRNRLIQIFPEAICVWEKKLRPIKKGTARMILNYLKETNQTSLNVQPLGLNYSCASKFGSDLYLTSGKAIDAGDFLQLYLADEQAGMMALTKAMASEMTQLIIQVSNANEDAFNVLEVMLKNELGSDDLGKHYERSKQLGKWMDEQIETSSEWIAFKESVIYYKAQLKSNGYRDHLFTERLLAQLTFGNTLIKIFYLCIGAPFLLLGIVFNILPYIIVEQFVKQKVKERIFEASAKVLLGGVLFQINWLLLFIFSWMFSGYWLYALITLTVAIITCWFGFKFSWYVRKAFGFIRLYFHRSSDIVKNLNETRKQILARLPLR
jgi:glycerol-3-phosphate O-acyltransferase / dihydroxyacetone phosphate acyltransferase